MRLAWGSQEAFHRFWWMDAGIRFTSVECIFFYGFPLQDPLSAYRPISENWIATLGVFVVSTLSTCVEDPRARTVRPGVRYASDCQRGCNEDLPCFRICASCIARAVFVRGLIQFEVVTAIMVVMLTISVPSSIGNTDAVLAQLLLLHLISILIPSVCGSCRYRLSCCCCCSFMRVYIYIVSIAMLILFLVLLLSFFFVV